MERNLKSFSDILEARRIETSNFMWISRELKTAVAYKQRIKPNPKWHKQEVLQSLKVKEIIQKICQETSISKEQAEEQIQLILDEIGFNKRLPIIRWLGLALTKICVKVCTGIYVNEESIIRLKQVMGSTPVIFLPSHRSYADFILMSYVCFTYDIEIPSIAAGMDFHGMWGMGSVLRDTGAFFMRRSYNNDSLYWTIFRQYINQLITKGDLPLEFFIEGTRSRSAKSLMPKFGLLSMILKPFFTSEVPDILFVPINISYDRILEEKLFTYELLGVPKPKESTSAFFKSLSLIKERYGNIYVDFAEPISAKNFFESYINRSVHGIKPNYLQELTQQEKDLTASLAYDIVHIQQKHSVITVFNLIALSITNNLISQNYTLSFDDIVKDVKWLKAVLEALGAVTDVKQLIEDIQSSLNIHKNLVYVTPNKTVELVKNSVALSTLDVTKLKGHVLSQQTMTFVVPYIMLQIYVNPVLHYLINPAILVTILRHYQELNRDTLFNHYGFLRNLFSYEFVTVERWDYLDFEESIKHLSHFKVMGYLDNRYYLINENKRLEELFCNILESFIFTYYVVCRMLIVDTNNAYKERILINTAQAQLEHLINNSERFIHPYCLNLDSLTNCLGSLTIMSAITKTKVNEDMLCQGNHTALYSIIKKLEPYVNFKLSHEELRFVQLKINLESKL